MNTITLGLLILIASLVGGGIGVLLPFLRMQRLRQAVDDFNPAPGGADVQTLSSRVLVLCATCFTVVPYGIVCFVLLNQRIGAVGSNMVALNSWLFITCLLTAAANLLGGLLMGTTAAHSVSWELVTDPSRLSRVLMLLAALEVLPLVALVCFFTAVMQV